MELDMNEYFIKQRIIDLLKNHGDMKKQDLLLFLDYNLGERRLRKMIEDLVVKDNELIGTSSDRGYFLIKNENDFNDAIKELKDKGRSLFIRANILYKNFYATEKDIQLNFFEAAND